jgi:methylphosphotriester-DNA--protein-cysteine methyltransferase
MIKHASINSTRLKQLVKSGEITMAGNAALKIYGTLHCSSGKRMKLVNRVFFATESEAIAAGYRPCGHCLRQKYINWRGHR